MRFSSHIIFYILLLSLSYSCSTENEEDNNAIENKTVASNPLFDLLAPQNTGLYFSNKITESFQESILNFSYLYNGGGVAVIDVNNDGLQDLYFSATQESNRLFLNKGDWKFEDITEKADVGGRNGKKTGVSVVDINADGFDDLYVCRTGLRPDESRKNLLFMNNGDLTFTERAAQFGLADASASIHSNFFDFDLDGDLDVYVLNHPVDFHNVNRANVDEIPGGGYKPKTEPLNEWDSDKFYRNDGNGKFTNISKQAGIHNRAWGLSATISDFNNDGYPDVFVGNDYIVPDFLYINNKNGTFSIQTDQYFRHQSNHTMGVDIADINNDGLVDLVGLDMVAEGNRRYKELMTTMTLDRYTNLVKYGYGHQVMRNVLQLNTGRTAKEGGVFSEIGTLSGISNTDWSWSPLMADFDNDGLKDIYVTNGYRRDVSNLDYLVYTSPSLAPGGRIDPQKTPTIQDYLKHVPSEPLQNYMFQNMDGLNFKNANQNWGLTQPSFSNGSAYADLDNDGDLDLIVNNIASDIMLYRNNSIEQKDGNWLQVELKGPKENPKGVGAQIRIQFGNGKMQYHELTPTRGFLSSSQSLIHFGLGEINSVEKLGIKWPNGLIDIKENIDVNQKLIISITDAKKGNWEIKKSQTIFERKDIALNFRHKENDFEDFNRERLLPHRFSTYGPTLATGDVNSDGLADVFIGGASGQAGAIYIQNSNSSFKKKQTPQFEKDNLFEDTGSTFFDVDGDGDLDLFVASGGSSFENGSANYEDRLYENDGTGNFTKSKLPSGTYSSSCAVNFDFDKDGDDDIIVGGLVVPGRFPNAPVTRFLKNDNGVFADICGQIAPDLQQLGMIKDMKWADLDGDGKEELLVAGEWLPISIFKFENGQYLNATESFGLSNTNGWWNCIEVADLDGDGDQDLVAGNFGLNSRLIASEEKPFYLYAKDFDQNGSIDPILAQYNEGQLYPLPLRDMLIKQLPLFKKTFVFYKDYSSTTMDNLFSKDELNNAQKNIVHSFATSWFENDNGKFIRHNLPTETQFSPINDLLVEDFNKDGYIDLFLAGNFYDADVETGRLDAGNGVLLLGKGSGKFQISDNKEHGFWATKQVRNLAMLTLANGQKLILIANNDDELESYVLKN